MHVESLLLLHSLPPLLLVLVLVLVVFLLQLWLRSLVLVLFRVLVTTRLIRCRPPLFPFGLVRLFVLVLLVLLLLLLLLALVLDLGIIAAICPGPRSLEPVG